MIAPAALEIFAYIRRERVKSGASAADFLWIDRMREAHERQHGCLSEKQLAIVQRIAGDLIDAETLAAALRPNGSSASHLPVRSGASGTERSQGAVKSSHAPTLADGLVVFTDGSYRPITGVGGYGIVALFDGEVIKTMQSDPVSPTSVNRQEATAVLAALRWMKNEGYRSGEIVSDSLLTIRVITGQWKAKANRDLFIAICEARAELDVKFRWVHGHNGDPHNEMADRLASAASRGESRNTARQCPYSNGRNTRRARREPGTLGYSSEVRHTSLHGR